MKRLVESAFSFISEKFVLQALNGSESAPSKDPLSKKIYSEFASLVKNPKEVTVEFLTREFENFIEGRGIDLAKKVLEPYLDEVVGAAFGPVKITESHSFTNVKGKKIFFFATKLTWGFSLTDYGDSTKLAKLISPAAKKANGLVFDGKPIHIIKGPKTSQTFKIQESFEWRVIES